MSTSKSKISRQLFQLAVAGGPPRLAGMGRDSDKKLRPSRSHFSQRARRQQLHDPKKPGPDDRIKLDAGRGLTKSSATLSGLTSGTKYCFRVAAIGAACQGAWSDPATKDGGVRKCAAVSCCLPPPSGGGCKGWKIPPAGFSRLEHFAGDG